mmetsp:Transcript_29837/g.89286  ORF Transcript_29837/g.89286 Transcript_29837/m.89286 type:complete len:458 (-) Transcript_29837:44-1417(-)
MSAPSSPTTDSPAKEYSRVAPDDAANRELEAPPADEVRNPLAADGPPPDESYGTPPPVAPTDAKPAEGSKTQAVVALVRCMVGPAVLFLPHGFADAGVGGGLFCVVVANAFFALGISRLIASWRVARDRRPDGAPLGINEVCSSLGGPKLDALARFCVISMQCGVGVTYFIFVAENIATLFPSANLPTAVLIGAMACVEMPLVLFKRIAKLHATNAAGNVLAACCLFSVFGVFVYNATRDGPAPGVVRGVNAPGSTLTFAGMALYAFEGMASIVVPVCDAAAPQHRDALPGIVVGTVAIVAVFFAAFGLAGYLARGPSVEVVATESLATGPYPDAVRGAYVAVVLLTFPLQLFPVTDLIARSAGPGAARRDAVVRVFLVLFLALLAVVFRHRLDHVVSILGAAACAPLALVVGPWAHLAVATTAAGRRVDYFCITVGWVVAAACTANAVATWGDAAS